MSLAQPAAFFDALRSGLLGPTLTPAEVGGLSAILAACEGLSLACAAYALATAYHETAHEMQPVKERGGEAYFQRMYDPQGARPEVAARLGNTEPGDGARYAGRGYVQLTGRANYCRAQSELGEPFVAFPDLALEPDNAAKIMRRGMEEGWFTGRGFSRYLPTTGRANQGQFTNARAIINGADRAEMIADYARKFQDALAVGGWS